MLASGWRNAAWAAILCLGAGAVRAEAPNCCATQKAACPCRAVKGCVRQCVQSLPGLSCCFGLKTWLSAPYCLPAKCLKGCAGVCAKGQAVGCCVSAGTAQCAPAGCPTASMPDPMPIATSYGVPPPMPVCSAPMLYSCVTTGTPAPAEKEYALEVKVVETRPGAKDKVTDCPRVVLFEGQCASVSFTDRLLLDECRPGGASQGCKAAAASCSGSAAAVGAGVLEAVVKGTGEGKMRLELGVEEMRARQGRRGMVELGKVLHACLDMTAGEPARVVVDRTPEGKPRRWLEAKVTVAPEVPEHRAAASHDVQEQIAALWDAVGDLAEMAERLIGERIAAGAPQPLPAPAYFPHPPQYMPPMPSVGPEPLPPPAMVVRPDVVFHTPSAPVPAPWLPPMPVPPPVPLPPPAVVMSAPAQPPAKEKSWVEIGAGANGDARVMVQVAGGAAPLYIAATTQQVTVSTPILRATADRVRVSPDGRVILEGHVNVKWDKDGQKAQVNASRVVLHPADGRLEVETGTAK